MATRARTFQRRSGTRSPTDWTFFNWNGVATGAGIKTLIATFVPSLSVGDETVIRCIGTINQNGIIGTLGIGLCVVTDAAAAVGIGSIPSPLTDGSDAIWVMHRTIIATTASAVDPVEFDQHGMRKVQTGQVLALVAEAAGASSSLHYGSLRLLSKYAVRT